MHQFIDIQFWPLVYLQMPTQIPDEHAEIALAQIVAMYSSTERFVLLLGGADIPRHSARFMQAYTQWCKKNFALQQISCVGAIRVEADANRRRAYARRWQAHQRSNQVPYPSCIVATDDEARQQAHSWLAAAAQQAVPVYLAGKRRIGVRAFDRASQSRPYVEKYAGTGCGARHTQGGVDPDLHRELATALALTPAQLPADANLLRLGLDSLHMMAWLNRLRARGYALTLQDMYRQPTVAGWSHLCHDRSVSPPIAPQHWPAMLDGQPFVLTPVQHAYLVGRSAQQALGGVGCHLYQELDGQGLSPDDLESAVYALLMRHPMLRVRFSADGRQRWHETPAWSGLRTHDLRALAPSECERALLALRQRLDHRVLAVEQGETFDFQLSLLPQGRHRLHVNLDLLILDAASFSLLFEELAALLRHESLAPLASHYDFRSYLAQLEVQDASARRQAQEYWCARMAQLPPAPDLPLACQPEQLAAVRFRRRRCALDKVQWQALKSAAGDCGVTPTMALASCFGAVLARWSGQSRLLLNLTLFDRQPLQPQVQQMIADFTTILLLDLDCSAAVLADLARANQHSFVQAYEHRHWSGVEFMRELRKQGSYPHGVPVVFTSNLGHPLYGRNSAAVLGKPGWGISQTPQVWLDHLVFEQDDAVWLQWDSVDALFPAGLMDTMFAAYQSLVLGLVQDPAAWQRALPELMPLSQRDLRTCINATSSALPGGLLHQGFFAAAARTPNAIALIDGDQELSYGQLTDLARRCATTLSARGVEPGQRVAVCMRKGYGQIVALLGAMYAGAIYVPVALEQPLARRRTIFDSAGVSQILVCQDQLAALADEDAQASRYLCWQDAVRAEPLAHPALVEPDTAAYIIYTSGSTGSPKGVMISHRSALNTCADLNQRFHIGEDDRVLALSALHFDLSVYDIFGVLGAGGALVLPAHSRDPANWCDLIECHQVTLWNSVPALFDMLLTYCQGAVRKSPAQLRLVLLSGDWIGLDLAPRYRAFHPPQSAQLVALGGATEAAIWSNAFEVKEVAPQWRSIPYGYPLANQCYRVVDALGRDCPDWVAGELWIGGAGVALGYVNDASRNASQFVQYQDGRWYRTGDRGCYWPDGTLEFLGRRDQQVKIGGHRIELGEVEAGLQAIDGIEQAVVLALGERDKSLAAFVVAGPGTVFRQRHAEAGLPADYGVLFAPADDALNQACTPSPQVAELLADFLLEHLQQQGLDFSAPVGLEQVWQTYGAAPAWSSLFVDWLNVLCRQQRLALHGGKYGQGSRFVQSRRQLHAHDPLFATAEALQAHHGTVAAILRGQRSPQTLLTHPFWAPEQLLLHSGAGVTAIGQLAQTVAKLSRTLQRPLHVIDIGARSGAGASVLLRQLNARQLRYTGLDASQEMVLRGQQRFAAAAWTHASMQRWDGAALENLRHAGDLICLHNCLHRSGSEALAAALLLAAPGALVHVLELDGAARSPLALVSADLLRIAGAQSSLRDLDAWSTLLQQHDLQCQRKDRMGDQQRLILRAPAPIQTPDPELLKTALAARLPAYMVPQRLHFLDALPLSANGKLDRQALLARCNRVVEQAWPQQAPVGVLEQLLATLWSALLQTGGIHRHSHFFQLGGDSLLATRLIGELQQHGYRAQLGELFHYPSLAAFAATIEADAQATPAQLRLAPSQRYEPFALSQVQQAYLAGRQQGFPLSGVGAHFFVEFDVAQFDVLRFEAAMNRLIERHDMLRGVVRQAAQQVLADVPHFVLPCHHFDSFDDVAAMALRDRMAYQVLDPAIWPPFDIQAGFDGSGHGRLYMCLDNLLLDGLSMQIFLAELEQTYLDPQCEFKPLELRFRDYQQQRARMPVRAESQAYWQRRLKTLPAAPQLPLRCAPASSGKPHFVRLSGSLSAATWTQLQERAAQAQLTSSGLLLAAYAAILSANSNAPELTLNLTLFDRAPLHPQIDQVLGDFTSLLLLAWQPDGIWLSSAQRLQQRLWQDLAHRDVSALWVMRQLAQASGQGMVEMPVVFTSALGFSQSRFLTRRSCFEPRWGISQTPQVWLDHQVYESDGELHFNWDAVQALFEPNTLCNMFDQYVALLQCLAHDRLAWQLSLPALMARLGVSAPAPVVALPVSPSLPVASAVLDMALVNTLRAHFQQVVGVPIEARKSFFEAGASSLKLVQLHAHLQQAGFASLAITDLFAHASPQALALHLGGADGSRAARLRQGVQP